MPNKLTTLRDVARELEMPKSTLHYYLSLGLIKPDEKISRVFLFNKKRLLRRIEKIIELQTQKLTLSDIKKQLG